MIKMLDQILSMLYSLSQKGANREVIGVSYESGVSKKEKASIRSFNFEGSYVVFHQDVFNDLSGPAIILLIEISKNLKMNNPLWYCEPKRKKKGQFRIVIAELIAKSIITKIVGSDMYIVNPYLLRKGNSLTGLFCIYDRFLRRFSKNKNWIPTPEYDLVDLKMPSNFFNPGVVFKGWEEGGL